MTQTGKSNTHKSNKTAILNNVKSAIDKPAFRYYMASCLKVWNETLGPETEIVDQVVESICGIYSLTIEELVNGKKTEPRALLFYVIKKHVKTLSYEIIGDMFNRNKSYVFEKLTQIEFLVEKRKEKRLVSAIFEIEKKCFFEKKTGGPVN